MRRESAPECPEALDRALSIAAQVCEEVRRLLLREVVSIHVGGELDLLQALANAIPEGDDPAARAMARDARFQVAALAGQLRSAVSLASHSIGAGQRAFERQEARSPGRCGSPVRWRSCAPIFPAILRPHSGMPCGWPAASRSASPWGRGIGLLRPYWIPMTIAIVLKPDFSSTFSRGVLRLAGTYVGLIVTTGLFHVMSPSVAVQIAMLAVFTFLGRCFGPANYGILTAAVSGLVVLLIALTGVAPQGVIAARGLNTTIGGLLALIAYAVWPTWERTQLPEAMAVPLSCVPAVLSDVAPGLPGRGGAGRSRHLPAERPAGEIQFGSLGRALSG